MLGFSLLAEPAPGQSPSDSVVAGVFRRQQILKERIRDVSYDADYRYTETDLRHDNQRRVICLRRVSMKGYEKQRHDVKVVAVNGRRLSGSELAREVNDLRAKGLVAGNTRMPLMLGTAGEYHYSLLGTESLSGKEAWVVSFRPVRASGRHVLGRALVLKDSFDVVELRFAPARRPLVVRDMEMRLNYQPVNGVWLPVRFALRLDLKLKVLFTVLDRHIEIEDVYSGYALNSGFEDSFFSERVVLPP